MKSAFSLRLRIPLLLFLFGLLVIAVDFAASLRLERREKERDLTARLVANGQRLAGMAQYFSGRSDFDGANMERGLTAAVPDLQLGLLCDEGNKILLSTAWRWRGQSLQNSPLAAAATLAANARATMSNQVAVAASPIHHRRFSVPSRRGG